MTQDKINDGGPAFPRSDERGLMGEGLREGSDGMSLRDYFAGQVVHYWFSLPIVEAQREIAAVEAYKVADAMLKAREVKP